MLLLFADVPNYELSIATFRGAVSLTTFVTNWILKASEVCCHLNVLICGAILHNQVLVLKEFNILVCKCIIGELGVIAWTIRQNSYWADAHKAWCRVTCSFKIHNLVKFTITENFRIVSRIGQFTAETSTCAYNNVLSVNFPTQN